MSKKVETIELVLDPLTDAEFTYKQLKQIGDQIQEMVP